MLAKKFLLVACSLILINIIVNDRRTPVHGSYEVKNLGKPVSHGCVRISPENATTLYALVEENGLGNTQVVLTGVTPGGEFKIARAQDGPGSASQSGPGWGFFGPLFGSPSYNGPQGYYRSPSVYSRR